MKIGEKTKTGKYIVSQVVISIMGDEKKKQDNRKNKCRWRLGDCFL